MDIEEEEAQVCRLCGQCENFYIDVFGEEGTKRFLGLKIHAKVNILMSPDDQLPHVVCVRCLGTLEFFCDFYDMCHQTQKDLTFALEPAEKKFLNENEDSDKENALPLRKKRTKSLQSDVTKVLQDVAQDENLVGQSVEIENPPPKSPIKVAPVNNSIPEEMPPPIVQENVPVKNTRARTQKTPNKTSPCKIKTIDSYFKVQPRKTTTLEPESPKETISKEATPPDERAEVKSPQSTENKTNGSETNSEVLKNDLGETIEKLEKRIEASRLTKVKTGSVTVKTRNLSKRIYASKLRQVKEAIVEPKILKVETSAPNSRATTPIPETISKENEVTTSDPRVSECKLGKLSDMMNEEEKAAIEKEFTVDMGRINETVVAANLIVLDRNKMQCNICSTVYNRVDKCQVHIWRHLDMKPYLCKLCDFSTVTISGIRGHIRKSHLKLKPYLCQICNKRYNSSSQLEEHLNTHTGKRPHQCSICDYACASKQLLGYHMLRHKPEKDSTCDICGKAFHSKGRMRSHRLTHYKDQAHKCKLCSTYFGHQEALDKHLANVHTRDYVCKTCHKTYKSKKALSNHENVHADAKYQCPLCPNIYKSTHILKEHILKHQGIRQYQCNVCQKAFAQQSHLSAHMAVHSNVLYRCPGCQKGFNRHDNMKVHTKRCDLFQSNPDLAKLLVKRTITMSKNGTTKPEQNTAESNKDDVILPAQKRRKSNEEASTGTLEIKICTEVMGSDESDYVEENLHEETILPIVTENVLAPSCF